MLWWLACFSALVSRKHCISDSRISQRSITIKPTVNPKNEVCVWLFSPGALTPRNSTEDSAVGAWCDLSVGLNRQTQMLELKTRVGRAIGKHGSVGNAVQNTHKVDVKYFADGTRRGVVYVTSDTRDLKACVAGIKRIQEVARASVPIGTLRLDHIERCFEGM